jgi:hypothetical protein
METLDSTDLHQIQSLKGYQVVPAFLQPDIPTDIIPQLPTAGESVLSFFTLEGLDGGLLTSAYTVKEEVELLVEIIRDKTDRNSQMAAMKLLRDRLREALIMAGGIQNIKATQVQTTEGGTLTAEFSGQRLRGQADTTERMLESATHTIQVLSLEGTEGEDDAQPTKPQAVPTRDLGGGGLCESSRLEANAARLTAGLRSVPDPLSAPEPESPGTDGSDPSCDYDPEPGPGDQDDDDRLT